MPLITLFANAAARGYGIMQGIKTKIVDTFIRGNTSGSLGTASDGSIWNAIRGVFTVVSNKAQGTDTNYPIVAQPLSPNVNISIKDISQGTGAAIWVTDSGNWWAVGADTGAGQNCNCSTCYNTDYVPGNYVYVAGNNNAPYYYQYGCSTCYNSGNAIYAYQTSNGSCPIA